jgi:membrane fusion protein (multidrug efflux system)
MGEYFVFIDKDTLMVKAPGGDAKKPDSAEMAPSHRAFQKKVMLGQTIGPNVIVKTGIVENDKIVVDGVQLLHDGSRINIATKKPGADSTQRKM